MAGLGGRAAAGAVAAAVPGGGAGAAGCAWSFCGVLRCSAAFCGDLWRSMAFCGVLLVLWAWRGVVGGLFQDRCPCGWLRCVRWSLIQLLGHKKQGRFIDIEDAPPPGGSRGAGCRVGEGCLYRRQGCLYRCAVVLGLVDRVDRRRATVNFWLTLRCSRKIGHGGSRRGGCRVGEGCLYRCAVVLVLVDRVDRRRATVDCC